MNIKYLHCRTIWCRFFHEATILISYRFLMSQFDYLTIDNKSSNISTLLKKDFLMVFFLKEKLQIQLQLVRGV